MRGSRAKTLRAEVQVRMRTKLSSYDWRRVKQMWNLTKGMKYSDRISECCAVLFDARMTKLPSTFK